MRLLQRWVAWLCNAAAAMLQAVPNQHLKQLHELRGRHACALPLTFLPANQMVVSRSCHATQMHDSFGSHVMRMSQESCTQSVLWCSTAPCCYETSALSPELPHSRRSLITVGLLGVATVCCSCPCVKVQASRCPCVQPLMHASMQCW